MSAASLNLLKGGKKSAMDEELKKPEPAPEPAAEPEVAPGTDVIDIDVMTSDEIDELVVENGVDVPEWWATSEVDKKREWLKATFEETEPVASAEEPTSTATPFPAEALLTAAAQKSEGLKKDAEKALADVVAEDESPIVHGALNKPKKPKKASKSKVVATSDVKEGEIVEAGAFVDMVHTIENYKAEEALEKVGVILEHADMEFIELGGVLSVVQTNEWYKPDYATFREYVEKKHNMEYRKAAYCTAIYSSLTEADIPWASVKGVSWTKLKEIAPILTVDNVAEWVEKAKTLNTISLIEAVKAVKTVTAIEDQSAAKTKKAMTFKAFPDQEEVITKAIDKAKESSGTDVSTVALEYICLDFLGGQSLAQRLHHVGIEKALEALEQAYPQASIEVTIDDTDSAAAA